MDYGRWVARFSSSFPHLALFFFPSCSSAISHRPAGRKGRKEQGRAAKMIYRNWSLLSSTFVIWGGVATAGLAGIFLFGGKELDKTGFCYTICGFMSAIFFLGYLRYLVNFSNDLMLVHS
ncbi:hypothetical protein E2562_016244 [Oryza meyeriana var. granulata]|uniref:Uncharacterized protein n=1 Tax=Oryza meyeriana var. granulata TaxID=110450 RepID=A0A6G1CQL4_9ORYZ|nr:hypothetical protein E2562_016244 [Oryza meyeriana var. granulata]